MSDPTVEDKSLVRKVRQELDDKKQRSVNNVAAMELNLQHAQRSLKEAEKELLIYESVLTEFDNLYPPAAYGTKI